MKETLELTDLRERDSGPSTPRDMDAEIEPFLASDDLQACDDHHDRLEAQKRTAKVTPLPKAQLVALCIVRLVDPIVFTQVFPYVNEMMDSLHLVDDPSRIGFYSGLVESTFAISQLFSIYQWARLSDIIGRRPVIIMGILGVSVTTLVLGFSRSLIGILTARFLSGLSAGNAAVVHSVLGEITDSTNQAVAFPIYGLCWPLGAIIGPMIGGTFSDPAKKYPSLFDYQLFRTYPYLLPGIIAAAIALTGATLGYFLLEETLPSKRRRPVSAEKGESTPTVSESKPPSIAELLRVPVIRALCYSGSVLAFISTAFDVVFVLFCYSPIKTGGLALNSSEIGYCLAMSGIISILIQIFVMPFLLRRFDSVKLYTTCMSVWPYTFIIPPLLNLIARTGAEAVDAEAVGMHEGVERMAAGTATMVWIGIACVLTMTRVACIAYSLSMILVRDHAPGPAALGSTNGLVQLFMSFARAFSPAFVSSMFALSLDHHLLGGYFWVVTMMVISYLGAFVSNRIPTSLKT